MESKKKMLERLCWVLSLPCLPCSLSSVKVADKPEKRVPLQEISQCRVFVLCLWTADVSFSELYRDSCVQEYCVQPHLLCYIASLACIAVLYHHRMRPLGVSNIQ